MMNTGSTLAIRLPGVQALLALCIPFVLSASAFAGESEAGRVECGYDGGFILWRTDDVQTLKLYGYGQVQWTGESDGSTATANEFAVRKARLLAAGRMYKNLDFKLHVDFASSRPLLDHYIDYKPVKVLSLRTGQFKAPMSRQYLTSAAQKQFIDDAVATSEFKLDRDIGVMLFGSLEAGLFAYFAGVFNGAGKNAGQDNTGFLYAVRFELAPLGPVRLSESDISGTSPARLAIGLASSLNTVQVDGGTDNGGRSTANRVTVGGDLTFLYRGLFATAEVFWRQESPREDVVIDTAAMGGYVQTGYLVVPSVLEIAARGGVIRKDAEESADRSMEAGGVVNWYLSGHRLKLQLGYTLFADEVPEADMELDHRVRLMLQAAF